MIYGDNKLLKTHRKVFFNIANTIENKTIGNLLLIIGFSYYQCGM